MGPPYMRLKSVYMRGLGVFNGIFGGRGSPTAVSGGACCSTTKPGFLAASAARWSCAGPSPSLLTCWASPPLPLCTKAPQTREQGTHDTNDSTFCEDDCGIEGTSMVRSRHTHELTRNAEGSSFATASAAAKRRHSDLHLLSPFALCARIST